MMNLYYKSIPSEQMSDYGDFYVKIANQLQDESLILECGIAEGRSIIMMASLMKNLGKRVKIFGVDNMDYGHDSQYTAIMQNIVRSEEDNITIFAESSLDAVRHFEDNMLDFIMIDSSHQYEPTKAEIRLWIHKLKEGGIMAFHDYTNEKIEGVKKAVDELIPKNAITVEDTKFHLGVAWFVKTKDFKLC